MATKNNQKIRDMVELLALTGKEMLPLAREGKNYKVTTKTLSEYIGSTGGGSLPTDAAAQIEQNTENIEIIQNNITSLSNQLGNNQEEIDDLGQIVNSQKTDIQNNSNRLDSIKDNILDISGDIEGLKSLATTTTSGLMSAQDKIDLNTLMVFYEGTDTDSTINSWKELEKFLEDFDTTKDLAELLSVKADKDTVTAIEGRVSTIEADYVNRDSLLANLEDYAKKSGYSALKVLATDSSGNIVAHYVSTDKLGYLSNVTSDIQAQINAISIPDLDGYVTTDTLTESLNNLSNTYLSFRDGGTVSGATTFSGGLSVQNSLTLLGVNVAAGSSGLTFGGKIPMYSGDAYTKSEADKKFHPLTKVDTVPTLSSSNLVTSGGVAKAVADLAESADGLYQRKGSYLTSSSTLASANLDNNTITIAGTSIALGGSMTQNQLISLAGVAAVDAKFANYLPLSGGTLTGRLVATAGGSGATSISYANAALTIGTVNRTGTASAYYPGIAFNHMYTYNSGTHYRNHAHAWIGLRLYDTPAAERSYLIFATNGDSTTGTSPVERMCISPSGDVGIGTTDPKYKLDVNGSFNATSGYIDGNTIIHSGNISSHAVTSSNLESTLSGYPLANGTRATGTWGIDISGSAANAEETSRFKFVVDVNSTNKDLNTNLFGGGLMRNYNSYSISIFENAPSDMRYGCVLEFSAYGKSAATNDLSGQLAWDVNHRGTDSTRNLWWRANDDRNFSNAQWHQIAFTDSTVAASKKLVTSQGTDAITVDDNAHASLSGNLIVNGTGIFAKDYLFMNHGGEGIYLSSAGISWHDSNNAYTRTLFAFKSNGYIGVDRDPDYKLDVNTSARVGSIVMEYDDEINRYGGTLYLQYRGAGNGSVANSKIGNIQMCSNGGVVGIGTTSTPEAKLHVVGDTKITGNLTVGGTVTIGDSRLFTEADFTSINASLNNKANSSEVIPWSATHNYASTVNPNVLTSPVSDRWYLVVKAAGNGNALMVNVPWVNTTYDSLKNPYSLTFGSKTYDGSSAKTITASDLGAVTSSSLESTLTDYVKTDVLNNYLSLAGGTMTGTIITPGDDSVVIKPAKNNYDQIGGEGIAFWKIFATNFYGTLNGNASTATKLQTSRNIWGQSFDGSGNVEGDLHLNASDIYWHSDKANYCIESIGRENASPYLRVAFYGGISFHTMDTERMHIKSSGNVGIGTDNPNSKLHVVGGTKIEGALSSYGITATTTAATDAAFTHYAGSTKLWWVSSYNNCANFNTALYVQSGSTPFKVATENDLTSYLPKAGGEMAAGSRISCGKNMYIGRADNVGWVGLQDICSQTSLDDGVWSIRTNGVAHFQSIYEGGTLLSSKYLLQSGGTISGSLTFSATSGSHIIGNANNVLQLQPGTGSGPVLPIKIAKLSSGRHTIYCDEDQAYDLGTSSYSYHYVYSRYSSASSDATKKNIIGNIPLTTAQIANAPAVSFTWKDSGEKSHGTIAQYWKEILPEFVSGDEGSYGLNYAALGVVSSIILARNIETHEQRIARLEKEISDLQKELNALVNNE